MDMQGDLTSYGFDVILEENVASALGTLDERQIDLAILDYDLKGRKSSEIANRLGELRIPFLVCSGSTIGELGPAFAGAVVIGKPFQTAELRKAVQNALPL